MVKKSKPIRFTRPVRKKIDETKASISFTVYNRMTAKQFASLKQMLLDVQEQFLHDLYHVEPAAADP